VRNPMREKGIGSFWARGSLSALDHCCIASFLYWGFDFTLFSYEPLGNVPKGVTQRDAAEVVPEDMVERVRYNGKGDLAHFSDLFRYKMIETCDLVWSDVDVFAVSNTPVPNHPNLISREAGGDLNCAVLYISDARLLNALMKKCERKLDKELRWGETGPDLLTEEMRKGHSDVAIFDHRFFYPIDYPEIWKVFVPEYTSECEDRCASAATLHLFNNILTRMGIWKDLAPPEGSYLFNKMDEMELIGNFRDIYPEKVMRQIVENYRFRLNGKDLGIRAIVRELFPSMYRTYHHYYKR